jgi:hypothetical protein
MVCFIGIVPYLLGYHDLGSYGYDSMLHRNLDFQQGVVSSLDP